MYLDVTTNSPLKRLAMDPATTKVSCFKYIPKLSANASTEGIIEQTLSQPSYPVSYTWSLECRSRDESSSEQICRQSFQVPRRLNGTCLPSFTVQSETVQKNLLHREYSHACAATQLDSGKVTQPEIPSLWLQILRAQRIYTLMNVYRCHIM